MSEQDINNEYPEMPTNNMNEDSGGTGLVGQSQVKDIIDSAAGIDPTRFWIVFMVALIIGLASTLVFGGRYLVNQGENKDVEITTLRQEIKECPQKTLEDLKKQQETIEQLRTGAINDSYRIQEIKKEKTENLERLQLINNKLINEVK